jgi:hypothetical protein
MCVVGASGRKKIAEHLEKLFDSLDSPLSADVSLRFYKNIIFFLEGIKTQTTM